MPGVPVTLLDDDDNYLVTGTHQGADGALTVIDRSKDLRICGVIVGLAVKNDTDSSTGAITVVTEHSFTCTLSGGTNNTFANGDVYIVYKSDTIDSVISRHYTDRLYGRKITDPAELNEDGRFPEDADLEDDQWSPGFPEKTRY